MKRVLSVIHYPTFGGPHNRNLRLMEPLARRGIETKIVLPDEPGNAGTRFQEAGVAVTKIPLRRLRASPNPITQARFVANFRKDISALRAEIRQEAIDVVLINGLVNPHAGIAARLEGVPVVWQILDTRTPVVVRRAMMPLVTRLADVVMSTGMEVARVHPGAVGLNERLVPFFPPVETSRFAPDPGRRKAARLALGIPEEARVVGTVGNLNPQKGHEYLLHAARLIRAKNPNTVLRILGAHTPTHAGYARRLHEEAREFGFEPRATFVDPGSRVDELLPAFDVFVLASVPRSEGIPTAILEAMACELPVVATDVGAVSEVVEAGVTGVVVPPCDALAVARAVGSLLDDPGLSSRMGIEARRRAVARYDVEACADAHLRAFEASIRHRSARDAAFSVGAVGER